MELQFTGRGDEREARSVVRALQVQQHLNPHQSIEAAMRVVTASLGISAAAGASALQALKLDLKRKIGRLKRCELTQLGRTTYRLSLQPLEANPAPMAPTVPASPSSL